MMNQPLKIVSALIMLIVSMSNACADRGYDRGERAAQREEQQMQRQDRYGRGQYQQGGRAPDAVPEAPRRRSNMTPEERRALRQQIHDAGREVYPPGR
jgi:hypothetical protein